MPGADNILYMAQITASGQVKNAQVIYGSSTIRTQVYGTGKLKMVRAWYDKTVAADAPNLTVEYINSNWIRSNVMTAMDWKSPIAHARNTKNTVVDDTTLIPNSAFSVTVADHAGTITGTVTVFVLFDVDYSAVNGIDPELVANGTKVNFIASTGTAITTTANTFARIGSFDTFDPGVTYVVSELTTTAGSSTIGMAFIAFEGLANQLGLNRLIPLISSDAASIVPTNQGTVAITKQSYTLGIIGATALTSVQLPIYIEAIATKNSIGA